MTRNLYNAFVLCFVLSFIAFCCFITQYIHFFSQLIAQGDSLNEQDPGYIFRSLFSPALIVSGIVLGIASLAYKILGIIFVAQKKDLPGGEQALWVLGFIFIGFITGIVFMALAKTKQWVTVAGNNYNT